MKKSILFSLLLIAAVVTNAQNGIKFQSDKKWNDIKAAAKASGKLIFVDAYATWCGPCKWMAKEVFTEDAVGKVFNEQFINAKFDMEEGEGKMLASAYKVDAYPTLLFIDGNGNLVHKAVGALEADELLDEAKKSNDPSKQYNRLVNDYQKGKLPSSDYLSLISALQRANESDKAQKVISEFLTNNPNWLVQPQLGILLKYTTDFESDEFQFILRNETAIAKVYGEKEITNYINRFVGNYVYNKTVDQKIQTYDRATAKNILLKYRPAHADKIEDLILFTFIKVQDTESGYEKAGKYFNTVAGNFTWTQLNTLSWYAFENFTSKASLELALGWALLSVKKESNFFNNDTAANLYARLGKKKEAKYYAETALKLGDDSGEDTSETKKLLKTL